MKKLFIFKLTLFSFISLPVFAETYFCSSELSRYNRPGEVESKIMERVGNSFVDGDNSKYKILTETNENLIAYTGGNDWGFIFFLDKITFEFGQKYFDINEFRQHPITSTYGKCIKSD